MALQLIELNEDVEYIDIDTSKVPYSFSIKLTDKTFTFTVKYNELGGFYTIDLYDLNGEVLMKKARNGVLQGGLICTSEEDCTTLTDREGNVVFRWLVHSAQD